MNRSLYLKFRIRTFVAGIIQSLRVRMARVRGFDIHPTVILERKLHLDRLYPAGVHIDEYCLTALLLLVLLS